MVKDPLPIERILHFFPTARYEHCRRYCLPVSAVIIAATGETVIAWYYESANPPSLITYLFYVGIIILLVILIMAAILAIAIVLRRPFITSFTNILYKCLPNGQKYIWLSFTGVLTVILGFGVWSSVTDGLHDSEKAVNSLISNATAAVLVGFIGWFAFHLVLRFLAFRKLCDYQYQRVGQGRNNELNRPSGCRRTQASSVVHRLRSSDYVFLRTHTSDAAESFIGDLEEALNFRHMISVVIRANPPVDDLPAAVRREFEKLMEKANVAPHPLMSRAEWHDRNLEGLAVFRRIVVIVEKMDFAAQTKGYKYARDRVAQHAEELIAARLPFIAIVEPASLPPREENQSITITPPNDVPIDFPEKHDAKDSSSERKQQKYERVFRNCVVSLRPTGLRWSTFYPGRAQVSDLDARIRSIERRTADLQAYGLIRFGYDLITEALRCSGDIKASRLSRLLLRKLIDHLVVTGGRVAPLSDLYDDMRKFDRLDILRTIRNLEECGLLEVSNDEGNSLGFRDPRLGEIAIGWWLARRNHPYSVSQKRTALCAAAELFGRLQEAASAPFPNTNLPWAVDGRQRLQTLVAVLQSAKSKPANDLSWVWREGMQLLAEPIRLAAIGGALNAALSKGYAVDLDIKGVWKLSDDLTQRAFVERLTPRSTGKLAMFLWNEAETTPGLAKRHPLRRTISRKLGSNGTDSWAELGGTWEDLVTNAEGAINRLCWETKPLGPRAFVVDAPERAEWLGYSISLLGSTLPSVAVSAHKPVADEAKALLTKLAKLVAPEPGDPAATHNTLDVGMQIALAEGLRDATYLGLTQNLSTHRLHNLLKSRFNTRIHMSSWYGRLVALQALFIAVAAEAANGSAQTDPENRAHDIVDKFRNTWVADPHRIVRGYATLLYKHLSDFKEDPHKTIGRFVWVDDNEAVSEAGGELEPEAVEILATVVCLLNFSGGREVLGLGEADPSKAREARIAGLTSDTLPKCFRCYWAALMAYKKCSCDIKICGNGIYDAPVRREPSRTFIDRYLSTRPSRLRPLHKHLTRLADRRPADLRDAIAAALGPPSFERGEWQIIRGFSSRKRIKIKLSKWASDELDKPAISGELKRQGYEVNRESCVGHRSANHKRVRMAKQGQGIFTRASVPSPTTSSHPVQPGPERRSTLPPV